MPSMRPVGAQWLDYNNNNNKIILSPYYSNRTQNDVIAQCFRVSFGPPKKPYLYYSVLVQALF